MEGHLHRPADPTGDCLILTHGAGANADAPLLVALAEAFCGAGIAVLRCDLAFRQARPHGPPPRGSAERDQQGLRAAVASMRSQTSCPSQQAGRGPRSGRMFLGGHSYGGRQATMLCAAEPGLVDALLLLSYPLHPPERPAELRTAHFPALRTPALFVSGAHDGFGSIDELAAALQLIPARTELLPIPGAGHELLTKKNRDTLLRLVLDAFRSFAANLAA
jgi:predicted alpha/beta-hydrolase family hydrolase